jgi:hypothetical protein
MVASGWEKQGTCGIEVTANFRRAYGASDDYYLSRHIKGCVDFMHLIKT